MRLASLHCAPTPEPHPRGDAPTSLIERHHALGGVDAGGARRCGGPPIHRDQLRRRWVLRRVHYDIAQSAVALRLDARPGTRRRLRKCAEGFCRAEREAHFCTRHAAFARAPMSSVDAKCATCNQAIEKDKEPRRFLNLYFHPECFRCKLCSKELEGERPFNHQHGPICAACHGNLRYPATSEGAYFHPTN